MFTYVTASDNLVVCIFIGHVEASIWLPGHMGFSDWRQLQRCNTGAAHRPGQDEESHHQTLETPDWHTDLSQLPGHSALLRLQSCHTRRGCHLSAHMWLIILPASSYISWPLASLASCTYTIWNGAHGCHFPNLSVCADAQLLQLVPTWILPDFSSWTPKMQLMKYSHCFAFLYCYYGTFV